MACVGVYATTTDNNTGKWKSKKKNCRGSNNLKINNMEAKLNALKIWMRVHLQEPKYYQKSMKEETKIWIIRNQ